MKNKIFTLLSSIIVLSSCSPQPAANTQPSSIVASPSSPASGTPSSGNPNSGAFTVKFSQVKDIIDQRCATCHSANSSDKSFGNMAGGVSYDTPELIKAKAQRLKARATISKDMPKANKTNITQEERDLLGKWVDEGANIN